MPNMVNSGAERLSGFVRRWMRDRRGSYAVIFALTLIPILIAIGAAVDISQAYIVKQRLTRALDAAGLAVGGMTGQTTAQIQTTAQSFFNANYPATKIGVPGALSVTTSGNVVSLSATATMPTSLMGIVGFNTLDIRASSQITRMGKKLEVVLALDNTGSMASSSKMTTLKTAAKDLITTVSAAAVNPGDVKVAIVPFNVDVNVGVSNSTASWLRWDQFTSSGGSGGSSGSCSWIQILLGQCSSGGGSSSHAGWDGCVMDRDQNYDAQNTLPGTSSATQYPASNSDSDNSDCELQTIMPLSTDWTALKSHIDDMNPAGNTNTTIGLAWGWNMLTQGGPLSNAAAPASNLDKVIVFLTDGDNTKNRWSSSESTINARTTLICNNLRTAGIKVYSIRVLDGNSTLIKACATQADMYYSVSNASQLTTVFQSIAQALSNLRISQ